MNRPISILIVEDSEPDVLFVMRELERGGYEPAYRRVETEVEFTSALAEEGWDVVIADYHLPGFSAVEALRLLQKSRRDLPFIIVSGAIGEEVAVAAMKSGAHDYILKSSLARLVPAVERELGDARVRRARARLEETCQRLAAIVESSGDAIIGKKLDGTITSWNRGAERIFGYPAGEVLGKSMSLLMPPERVDEEIRILDQINRGQLMEPRETVRIAKGGKRIEVSVAFSAVRDESGKPVGASQIARDITERKAAEADLRSSREQLRALAAHLQSVREEERKLIAREIHDELGQSLTGFKMDLAWIRNRLECRTGPVLIRPLLDKLSGMGLLLDGTANLVRKLCAELRPGALDDLGLQAAIEWQAREYQGRTGIACHLNLHLGELTIDAERSTALFRIFQEVLTNVARHARAKRVDVKLEAGESGVLLEVKDNGRGIQDTEKAGATSLGLLGMRERAYILGGDLSIEGKPGRGTVVRVRIPLPDSVAKLAAGAGRERGGGKRRHARAPLKSKRKSINRL